MYSVSLWCSTGSTCDREMGFSNPLQMLQSMPDVVECLKLQTGQTVLRVKANQSNQHLADLVARQKKTNNPHASLMGKMLRLASVAPAAPPKPAPSTARDDDEELLVETRLLELLERRPRGCDLERVGREYRELHGRPDRVRLPSLFDFVAQRPQLFRLWKEADEWRVSSAHFPAVSPTTTKSSIPAVSAAEPLSSKFVSSISGFLV